MKDFFDLLMNRGSHHRWCSGKKGVLINLRKRCNLIALCNPIFKGFVTLCIPKPIVICNPALSYFAIFKPIALCHPSLLYFVISMFYRCVYQKLLKLQRSSFRNSNSLQALGKLASTH